MSIASQPKPIGGFFELATADIPLARGSVWDHWTGGAAQIFSAWTARAALAALIGVVKPAKLWLPAYVCRELAAAAGTVPVSFYPLDANLSPDVGAFGGLADGDMVVTVDYFGWPPGADFQRIVAARPSVVWVEDRAQALSLDAPPFAPFVLYSPRKLMGVAGGGLLVAAVPVEGLGPSPQSGRAELALPELMRLEDPAGLDNARWYDAYRAREQALSAELQPIARLTVELLRRIPVAPLVEARRRNYLFLEQHLGSLAAWPRAVAGVAPFGFPIKVGDAGDLSAKLAADKLFCARHWADLPSDPARFPAEHALARQLLTVPCDQRWSEADLLRLVEGVRRHLG